MTSPGVAPGGSGTGTDVSVVLPAAWRVIPLRDPAARQRAIHRLVADTLQGEELAALAAEVAQLLAATAADADRSGGRHLAISVMRASNGVPLPASLVISVREFPGTALATPAAMLEAVEALLDAPGADRPDGQWHLHVPTRQAVIPMGMVVRVVRLRQGVPGQSVGEDIPTLAADYWIATPGGTAAAHLAFSTPLVLLHEAMLELFDAVAASARWRPREKRRESQGTPAVSRSIVTASTETASAQSSRQ